MVLGVSELFQLHLTFLDVRLVIGVSIDIFLVFLFFFVIFLNIIVTGLNVSQFNQMVRYWDGLSVTQLLVRHMWPLGKGRLAE